MSWGDKLKLFIQAHCGFNRHWSDSTLFRKKSRFWWLTYDFKYRTFLTSIAIILSLPGTAYNSRYCIWGNQCSVDAGREGFHNNSYRRTTALQVVIFNRLISFVILFPATLHRNVSQHRNFEPCSTKELVPCQLLSKFVFGQNYYLFCSSGSFHPTWSVRAGRPQLA